MKKQNQALRKENLDKERTTKTKTCEIQNKKKWVVLRPFSKGGQFVNSGLTKQIFNHIYKDRTSNDRVQVHISTRKRSNILQEIYNFHINGAKLQQFRGDVKKKE